MPSNPHDPYTPPSPQFAQILKLYRKQQQCSQASLATQLGISRNYLSQIERGVSNSLSFKLARRILTLCGHSQIEIIVPRRITVDVAIAPEIFNLNLAGVTTKGCCVGPPPTAMIQPSSVEIAQKMGYAPEFDDHTRMFCIALKTQIVGGRK